MGYIISLRKTATNGHAPIFKEIPKQASVLLGLFDSIGSDGNGNSFHTSPWHLTFFHQPNKLAGWDWMLFQWHLYTLLISPVILHGNWKSPNNIRWLPPQICKPWFTMIYIVRGFSSHVWFPKTKNRFGGHVHATMKFHHQLRPSCKHPRRGSGCPHEVATGLKNVEIFTGLWDQIHQDQLLSPGQNDKTEK